MAAVLTRTGRGVSFDEAFDPTPSGGALVFDFVDGSIGLVIGDAALSNDRTSTIAATLGDITAGLTGTVIPPVFGTIAATLGALTLTASGVIDPSLRLRPRTWIESTRATAVESTRRTMRESTRGTTKE